MTSPPTLDAKSNAWLIEQFLPVTICFESLDDGRFQRGRWRGVDHYTFLMYFYPGRMIFRVRITRKAAKQAEKAPKHVRGKLATWIDSVRHKGVEETRKMPGFHDEPLSGHLKGKRSIRLSAAYRAIYEINQDGDVEFAEIQRVSKHDYR